jgi:2-hydroxychromene-2-carboxylate isomerase
LRKNIDYYFTVTSPWSYLGDIRVREVAAHCNATLQHRPVNAGEIFSKTGGLSLKDRSAERQAYRLRELARWRERLGIELNLEPEFFPASSQLADKVIIATRDSGIDPGPLTNAFMRAVWVEDENIADPEVVKTVLDAQGLDAVILMASAQQEETARVLAAHTKEAISRGVFGLPSYVTADDLFWGQDRLEFLESSLTGHESSEDPERASGIAVDETPP